MDNTDYNKITQENNQDPKANGSESSKEKPSNNGGLEVNQIEEKKPYPPQSNDLRSNGFRGRRSDYRNKPTELRVRGNEVKVKEGESFENTLKRFNKQCSTSGVFAEVKKRREFMKPSVRRKKKSEEARKRKFKFK